MRCEPKSMYVHWSILLICWCIRDMLRLMTSKRICSLVEFAFMLLVHIRDADDDCMAPFRA